MPPTNCSALAFQLPCPPCNRLSSYGEEQLRWLDAELAQGKHTLVMVSLAAEPGYWLRPAMVLYGMMVVCSSQLLPPLCPPVSAPHIALSCCDAADALPPRHFCS
jgi:hypothetical protein